MKVDLKLSEKILPSFDSFHNALDDPAYLWYALKGGRISAKSSHVSMEMVMRRMKLRTHGIALRKHGVHLELSVYEQVKWAISYLGVAGWWRLTKNPLRAEYIPTGTKIFFLGADEPAKTKSLKASDYPISDLWIEEPTEFKTEEELQTLATSVTRDEIEDTDYKIILSYNPPKRKSHWLNKKFETILLPKNVFVHHSDYRSNPFIARQALIEIEMARETQPLRYEWEFLGKPIGSGVTPFQNLEFRTISDDEYKTFNNIRQGNDWGYAADPLAFVRWHYDKTRRRIFAMDEIYRIKLSNRELAEMLWNKGYERYRTKADSAEPKSIDEMKEYGCKYKEATKGPGSVEYGEKWLDDLEAIVIDPKRTPNIAKEFEGAEYEVDRDGNIKNRIVDKDNHTIDATRYAFEDDMISNNRIRTMNKAHLGL